MKMDDAAEHTNEEITDNMKENVGIDVVKYYSL